MPNLLKAEFFKLKKSFAYQFMLGAYLVFEFWYGNALHLVKEPVMKGILEFVSRLRILLHVGEWYWDEQAVGFPFMLTLIVLARTILVISAAAYIFCRHDMK